MHKKILKDWEARRSGAGITIDGKDASSGETVKLADIAAIETVGGHTIATGRGGDTYELQP